jgi:hypothetical protein
MSISISNDQVVVLFDAPGSVYKGSRFDWNGQVVQITWNQFTFCSVESINHVVPDLIGRGLFCEFGIDQPIGYEDCIPGDQFLKVGVGLLTKETKDPYFFYKPYRLQPAKFTMIQQSKEAITFICESELKNGYGYRYEKRFKLDGQSLLINYTLRNTGINTINTNEYCHNFISINHLPVDKQYRLLFSNAIQEHAIVEKVNPDGIVNLHKDRFTWKDTPRSDFFFSGLKGLHNPIVNWSIEHIGAGVGITERVDFIPLRCNLWGRGHVISPELFYAISLAPGEQTQWQRNYTVYNLLSGS